MLQLYTNHTTAAVAQWLERGPRKRKVVFESQPRQTLIIKKGSDSSASKRSAIGESVTGPQRWPSWTDAPCHSRCGMQKNPNCLMAMSAEHGSKFEALHR